MGAIQPVSQPDSRVLKSCTQLFTSRVLPKYRNSRALAFLGVCSAYLATFLQQKDFYWPVALSSPAYFFEYDACWLQTTHLHQLKLANASSSSQRPWQRAVRKIHVPQRSQRPHNGNSRLVLLHVVNPCRVGDRSRESYKNCKTRYHLTLCSEVVSAGIQTQIIYKLFLNPSKKPDHLRLPRVIEKGCRS
jgi:hypothetical protein